MAHNSSSLSVSAILKALDWDTNFPRVGKLSDFVEQHTDWFEVNNRMVSLVRNPRVVGGREAEVLGAMHGPTVVRETAGQPQPAYGGGVPSQTANGSIWGGAGRGGVKCSEMGRGNEKVTAKLLPLWTLLIDAKFGAKKWMQLQ